MSLKHFVIGLWTVTIISGAVLLMPKSSAESQETTSLISVAVEANCTISSQVTSPHSATIEPGTVRENIGSTTIKAVCNDPEGYEIYAIGYSDKNGDGDTNMYSTDGKFTIPTGTAISGNTSAWSMKLAAVGGTYTPTIDYAGSYSNVPSESTKVAHMASHTDTDEGSSITTTYKVYVAPTQIAGTYTGKVKYSLSHPYIPPTPTMQDFTCSSLASGASIQLQDSRDGNMYWVTKLPDNNCWMTQNLEYKLIANHKLTSADSDVTSDWTIPSTTQTAGYDTIGSAAEWPNINDAHSYYPKEDAHVGTEGDYGNDGDTYGVYDYFVNGTTKAHYTSDAACASANSTTEENCAHWRTGIYYNWNAATAGSGTESVSSGNATSSICPKGWRLPTGGSSGEFQTLLGSVSATDIVKTPYFFLRGGYYGYDYAGVYYYGDYGYYWSSTANSSDYAYYLDFYSSYVDPANNYDKQSGYFVRCISR